jgi:molybdopterin guanine dinucleotide-containing S/N-oxide reductase-like protein
MSDQSSIQQEKEWKMMTRRSFLKWSAAVGGTAALATTMGVGLQSVPQTAAAMEAAPSEGNWVSAACWHNCGGRCVNYALVKDGVVIRQKTDDTHEDTPDFPQQRGCARGRSQRQQVFGADRIKYPMKRKNWAPGGGKKELRGKDEWVRISWDEALNIVSSEIKRVKEKYGNTSIFVPGGSEIGRTLTLYGGFVSSYGTTSGGTLHATKTTILGYPAYTYVAMNDRMDHRKTTLFVHWGLNSISSSGGNPTYNHLQDRKGGAKIIVIDPYYTDAAHVLADEWIPIRPNTDHAMVLGMAYTLISEDDPKTNPLIDWDFLNRCTIGFDRDHMPPDADPKDNFKDYVLGTYDGVPKTPQWASEICGVDPVRIRSLALEIARTKNVGLGMSSATCRQMNADSWPQMYFTFGAMSGHIGKPGSFTADGYYHQSFSGVRTGPDIVSAGASGLPGVGANPIEEAAADVWTVLPKVPGTRLCESSMWRAIAEGKYQASKGEWRDLNIQLIYHGGGAKLQTVDGMGKGIESHRKVEFVVSHAQILTTNARYSDVVLPVTTPWERDGGAVIAANREIGFIWGQQVTQPLYEAHDDIWIAAEIGKRLGLDDKKINPMSNAQQVYNQLASSTVLKEDGKTKEPLVTITPEDVKALAEAGVTIKTQTGRVLLQEFQARGYYQVPRKPGDAYEYVAFKDFREDPAKNKLPNKSGKLEIYSKTLADIIESRGWSTIKPIPTYNPAQEGYEATFQDFKNKIKGEFPLQLYTIHYYRRSHSVFDNIPQLRRAFPQEFFMNPLDAAERGIKQGDIVLIRSRHGKTIRPVALTQRMLPGVVTLPHGAWVEMDEGSGVDKAGADNIINGAVPTGQGVSGWNTCNVQVEKYNGAIELKPDYQWPLRISVKEA